MSPALRDLLEIHGYHEAGVFNISIVEEMLRSAFVQGVKIGGIYRHWKGKDYLVTDVVRDADDWETFKVVYVEVTDARHRAERRLSWFLGDTNDGRARFRLVG